MTVDGLPCPRLHRSRNRRTAGPEKYVDARGFTRIVDERLDIRRVSRIFILEYELSGKNPPGHQVDRAAVVE